MSLFITHNAIVYPTPQSDIPIYERKREMRSESPRMQYFAYAALLFAHKLPLGLIIIQQISSKKLSAVWLENDKF